LAYTYVGFPALTLLRGLLRPRPFRTAATTPAASVVIAAYNEAAAIGAKLENLLELDYPRDRLEVVIASDGSDDGTNEIVRRYTQEGVRLLELARAGKARALNAAIESANGDILVFSDANSIYERGALRELVRPFSDPAVGGVAGNQRYRGQGGDDGVAIGERQYWDFDRLLKLAQSRAGSVTGATGAIYAVRRSLVRPVQGGVNDDLLNSLRVVAAGYRMVFTPAAVAHEPVSRSGDIEFARKVRVMVRGFRCVLTMRELLNPFQYGFFSVQLLSHKVLLRTMVLPLGILAGSSVLLWRSGTLYRAAAVGQAALYASGTAGILLSRRPLGRRRALALPAYFCLVNAASAKALWSLMRGGAVEQWETRRSERSQARA
jgi:cellulose synthase/poly-beta-1,6-N-acetylglucosamine synthase-like glycosyltransferase